MRYYDCIFNIIKDQLTDERKEYFHSKNIEKFLDFKNTFGEKLKT